MSERVKPADAFETVRSVELFLADNEWGNRIMQDVADRYLRDPDNLGETPLVVRVVEHGGWSLSFALVNNKIEVVGSANDRAEFGGEKGRFRDRIYFAKWHYLPAVRRNDTRVYFGNLAVGERFYNGEHQWEKLEGRMAKKIPHYEGDNATEEFGDSVAVNRIVPVGWDHV